MSVIELRISDSKSHRLQLGRESVKRVVLSLLQHELTLLRRGAFVPTIGEWTEETSLYQSPIGINSLERLQLATAVSEVFHLYETVSEDLLLRSGTVQHWVDTVMTALGKYSQRFSVRTSGSLGRPRLCTHEWELLEQEVPEWAALIEGRKRVVSHVPPHHIYGFLNAVLLPSYLGIPVVDVRIDPNIQLEPGDLIVSFPERLELLAASGRRVPEDVVAITSTAPLKPATASHLRAKGLASLLEMYGCSEVGGIAYRFHSSEPFTLLPYFTVADDGDLIRTGPDGRLRAIEIPDVVSWVNPRSFRVDRRKDGAVQVGGINVFPQAIADRLSNHPFLSGAYVRTAEIQGQQRLKAFLVVDDARFDTDENRKEILEWMRQELRTEEVPAAVTFGLKPPRNEMGKLIDWN